MSNGEPGPREEDRPTRVQIDDGMLRVTLQDGREISTPLDWYPRLAQASSGQLANVELSIAGIHWPDLDEDLSVSGMLQGHRPARSRQIPQRAEKL